MDKKIKKLIIPAAGWGTRFMPLTKVVFKEMIPILAKPLIEILIDDALEAGIEEVILILSKRKKNLVIKYFEPHLELEEELIKNNNLEALNLVQKTNKINKIKIIYQEKQLGLAHAISLAAKEINDEPFAVILGDDLIVTPKTSMIKQMINKYNQHQTSIICVKAVDLKDIHKYGIIDPQPNNSKNKKVFKIQGAVEKPKIKSAPSNKAILGHYIFTPKLMEILTKFDYENNPEINLVKAFDDLLKDELIHAFEPKEFSWYDLGSVEGFVKATIDFALKDKKIGPEIKKYLKEKIK